jgi:hypothetical protein
MEYRDRNKHSTNDNHVITFKNFVNDYIGGKGTDHIAYFDTFNSCKEDITLKINGK